MMLSIWLFGHEVFAARLAPERPEPEPEPPNDDTVAHRHAGDFGIGFSGAGRLPDTTAHRVE